MSTIPNTGALAGIRVVDLSRILGGPYCGQILGDHGADVLKVEPPQGDDTRTWGPPFKDGVASYYMGLNRNKRLMRLDLTADAGRAELMRLLADAERGEFRDLLHKAVADQLDGSKPACFLSGGTDSSTIAGMIGEVCGQPADTYSIGFEAEGYDESAPGGTYENLSLGEMVSITVNASGTGVPRNPTGLTVTVDAAAMPRVRLVRVK